MIKRIQCECEHCRTTFDVSESNFKRKKRLNTKFLCKKCQSNENSNRAKNKWKNMTQKEKDNKIKTLSNGQKKWYNNLSEKEKKQRLDILNEGHDLWYNNLTEEEKDKRLDALNIGNKRWYSNLLDEEKKLLNQKRRIWWNKSSKDEKELFMKHLHDRNKEWWNNMTQEEQDAHMQPVHDGRDKWYNSLSNEDKEILKQVKRDEFNKLSEEEQEKRIQKMVIGHHIWWDSLYEEEKQSRIMNMTKCSKEWWDNLSEEEKELHSQRTKDWWGNLSLQEYHDLCLQIAIEWNNSNHIKNNESDTEIEFANLLSINKINYDIQYYNIEKYLDFEKLFPYNPITKSDKVNPYHKWDFRLKIKDISIFVDVDGSVHDSSKTNNIVSNLQGIKFILKDYIQFKDSQRIYQTDNLDAYIIRAYKDNLYDKEVTVEKLQTKEIMTLNQFISIISYMNDKNN